ncbi:MAG: AAA family ATPase [Comamonadaceae bacterium]|nr:AAA family ATPase [Comamonadaceae bacterium]
MKDDILIAEEPEIHLHPKAQAELGDFLLGLNQKGVQSIIETHSEHMIVRLQQVISVRETRCRRHFDLFCRTHVHRKTTKKTKFG